MNLLVTGANGFLGRYVVAEALRRGHSVRAMVRSTGDAAKHGWDDRVTPVQADLRRRRGLTEAVAGVDAVLHLAASKAGDMYAQYAGTVVATENLLSAMDEAGVRRIVAISSFSVYDYRKIPRGRCSTRRRRWNSTRSSGTNTPTRSWCRNGSCATTRPGPAGTTRSSARA
jgi:nucleoside-diphosphate-sugar epimerase